MSANNLARYVVRLEAETAKYQRELEGARKKLGSFEKSQSAKLAKMGAQFGALAAAAGSAFAVLVRQSINASDNIAKLAQQAGVSTESLSQLQFAAQLSGTSLESLNTGLQRLSRSASDAANGSQAASRAFARIGVSAANTDGSLKATEQLLLEVAEQFSQYEDGAGKAALAQELFGRSGAQLLPLLNQGKDGIEALKIEADALGLTIDTKAAAAAERFNDNLSRLQSSVRGIVNQATARLLPTLEAITESFVEAVRNSNVLETALGGLENAFKSLVTVALGVAAAFNAVGTILGATAAAVAQRDFKIIGQAFEDLRTRAVDQIEQIVSVWSEKSAELARNAQDAGEKARKALTFDVGTEDKLRTITLSVNTQDAIKELDNARSQAASIFARTRTDVENYSRNIQDAIKLLNRGLIDQDTFDRWVSQHAEGMQQVADETQQKADRMSEFGKQAARNIQSAFAQFLYDPFKDGLDGMLKNFSRMLRQMVAEVAAQQILKNLFGGLAGSSNSFLSGIGAAFGGARAMGGPVSAGKSYLVGERGPEMFVPGASGQIVPNGGAGVTNNWYIDGRGTDPAIVETNLRRFLEGEFAPRMLAGTINTLTRPQFA